MRRRVNVAETVRRLSHALESLPTRMLHRLRRRVAVRRLVRRRRSGVLFVCHGNICRSPYAAATFSQRLGALSRSGVRVDSAGFIGPGRPAPRHAVEVAARCGLDLSEHRSQLVSPANWGGADLVVVMEPGQRDMLEALYGRDGRDILVLGDLDPQPGATRAIADPIGQPQAAFEESYARIDRCVGVLVEALINPTQPHGGEAS